MTALRQNRPALARRNPYEQYKCVLFVLYHKLTLTRDAITLFEVMFTQDKYVIAIEIAAFFRVKFHAELTLLVLETLFLEFLKLFFPAEFNLNSQDTVLHWCSMIGSLSISVHSSVFLVFQ